MMKPPKPGDMVRVPFAGEMVDAEVVYYTPVRAERGGLVRVDMRPGDEDGDHTRLYPLLMVEPSDTPRLKAS